MAENFESRGNLTGKSGSLEIVSEKFGSMVGNFGIMGNMDQS